MPLLAPVPAEPGAPADRGADRAEPRRPAVAIAAALAAGVCLDRGLAPLIALPLAVGAAAALLGLAAPAVRRAALLVALVAVGAAAHHVQWRAVAATDVSRRVGDDVILARLTGVLMADPREYEDPNRPSWEDARRSVAEVRCERLDGEDGPVACSGRIRLYAAGSLGDLGAGDRIRALGWLGPVQGPSNPGEWDRRAALRREGIRCEMSADAGTVERLAEGWNLSAPLDWLRGRCARRIDRLMPERAAAAAKALLLGDRTDLTRDDRRRFMASGAMHLLAISGLHVGLLAAFAAGLCRLAGFGAGPTAVLCVAAVVGFALLAEFRPPVLRAVLFVMLAATAWAARRTLDLFNTLCAAAAVVLLVTPASLFEPGTQLSFVAVAGLEWGRRVFAARPPWWPAGRLQWGERLWDGYRLTAGIAVWTAPLVAANFGLVSVVGYALNILLLPAFGALLGLGFVTLGLLIVVPPLATWPGVAFGVGLTALLWIVDAAAALPGGHFAVPPPPPWWLAGWYAGLLGSLLLPIRRIRTAAGRGALLAAGTLWAIALSAAPGDLPEGALRVTALDVGHGSATLIELPDGRTLLYDCGSLSGGERAADAVAAGLRARGRTRLDEIVISHADMDHFNGLPELLTGAAWGGVRIGGLSVGPHFLASGQEDARAALEAADALPLARLARGLTRTAGGATLTVLHPGATLDPEASDNDRSVVILIEYADRRLLLTGDLEGEPQRELVERFVQRYGAGVDLLLAPHHGGRRANPATLAEALQPRIVVASGAQHADPVFLRSVYPRSTLFLTSESGAVTVTVTPEGTLEATPFLPTDPAARPPR
ncbi:ComEC/Rec2 family competence protein [Alienimonas californiensis]|uniref:ComEC family competence protein n=1 Tax=Alienimonas californiensis TaxID=2527989 RepID=A0A517PDA9_9PLAN|nr:ComEC/Rec2 family competence protein [Alienimonas californiensis]QDT17362.1 ComEC family competence protein [Alienimonas californiensis]